MTKVPKGGSNRPETPSRPGSKGAAKSPGTPSGRGAAAGRPSMPQSAASHPTASPVSPRLNRRQSGNWGIRDNVAEGTSTPVQLTPVRGRSASTESSPKRARVGDDQGGSGRSSPVAGDESSLICFPEEDEDARSSISSLGELRTSGEGSASSLGGFDDEGGGDDFAGGMDVAADEGVTPSVEEQEEESVERPNKRRRVDGGSAESAVASSAVPVGQSLRETMGPQALHAILTRDLKLEDIPDPDIIQAVLLNSKMDKAEFNRMLDSILGKVAAYLAERTWHFGGAAFKIPAWNPSDDQSILLFVKGIREQGTFSLWSVENKMLAAVILNRINVGFATRLLDEMMTLVDEPKTARKVKDMKIHTNSFLDSSVRKAIATHLNQYLPESEKI